MSITFVHLGVILLLTTPSAIALSVCSGVGGCGWPISSRMIQIYTASCALMYRASSSASVADDITCLSMCVMLRMAPLLGGMSAPLERKKCPPALLHDFGSLR